MTMISDLCRQKALLNRDNNEENDKKRKEDKKNKKAIMVGRVAED